MNAKELVDSLFAGYEETATLADFKEELLGNLNAKIESLVKNGMDAPAAFAKASAELGDVSALADELSLKKRKEVFEEVYMDMRRFMNPKRVAAYVVFGLITLFGIVLSLIVFLSARRLEDSLNLSAVFATFLPFITAAVTGFTWLGMTQETPSEYPLSAKRAAWYAVAAGLIVFGLGTMPVVYLGSQFAGKIIGLGGFDVLGAIAILIPFVLPGAGLLAFLVLTEKDRHKPWVKEYSDKLTKQIMESSQNPFPFSNGAAAARFGLFSGAIWLFAIGLFILLGFLIGFKFSWMVFIFATAFQLMVQGMMSRK